MYETMRTPQPCHNVPARIVAQGGPLLVKSLCSKAPGAMSPGQEEADRDHSITQFILKVAKAYGR